MLITSFPISGQYCENFVCLISTPSNWVFIHIDEVPLNLLILSPISLSVSWYKRCYSSLTTFVALLWICSIKPVYFLHWEAQQWTQCSRCGIPSAEQTLSILEGMLIFLAAMAHSWHMVSSDVHQESQVLHYQTTF